MPENRGPALIDPEGGWHELSRREYETIVAMAARVGICGTLAAEGAADTAITTGQAAEILGVSRRTVTRMLDRGEIPGIRLGLNHHRSVRLSDVLAYRDHGSVGREPVAL